MPMTIVIPDIKDAWDPRQKIFISQKGATLVLEHSLVSLQKWEAKWHVPYMSTEKKTNEQVLHYIECMTVFPKTVDPEVYKYIPKSELERIANYIKDPMTATTFSDTAKESGASFKKEIITAEVIYYWMIQLGIPNEYRKWHLNQLMSLIHVCELKSSPQKKMGKNEILARNRALNAKRKAALHSKG